MALRKIRIYDDPILRKKSKHVKEITKNVETLVGDMIETMYEYLYEIYPPKFLAPKIF
mgnify:CR=1 FL=1